MFQSADRQEEGAHKEANECVYGLGSSRTSSDVKTVSQPPELRAEQVAGKAVEVSIFLTYRRRPLDSLTHFGFARVTE